MSMVRGKEATFEAETTLEDEVLKCDVYRQQIMNKKKVDGKSLI